MNLLEKFTTVVVEEKSNEQKKLEMSTLLFVLLIKLALIYLVATVLWPRIMPDLFKGVKPNPSFTSLLGLSVIVNLLL
tara:strand:- start:1635 stop:1868 length:234 start_codon:yes stop_codon:yes gene_type:complete